MRKRYHLNLLAVSACVCEVALASPILSLSVLHVKVAQPTLYSQTHYTSRTVLCKMVYYFTSKVVDPPAFIYVGKDKVESKAL